MFICAAGAPSLEFLADPNWPSGSPHAVLATAARVVVCVCCCGALGGSLVFFHRALSNINYITGKRLLTPNDAVLAVLPGTNLMFMPLVWYDAHFHSRRLYFGPGVTRYTSIFLATAAFGLLLIAMLIEVLALVQNMADPSFKQGSSRIVVVFCAATSGALLFARIIMEIRNAQEAIAASWRGYSGSVMRPATPSALLELARLSAVGLLVVVGVVAGSMLVFDSETTVVDRSVAREASPEQRLQSVADRMNKAGRTQLDQVTWLVGAKVESGVFVYEYVVTINKISNAEVLSFLQKVQPNIIRSYCTDPTLSIFRELKTTLVVRYMYADRAPLGQVNVSLGDCTG